MAQSYDVYYARMLLTLGLVDKDEVRLHLQNFQRSGSTAGFRRYLVSQQVITDADGQRASSELDKWLKSHVKKESSRDASASRDSLKPVREPASSSKEALTPTTGKPRTSSRLPSVDPKARKTSGVRPAVSLPGEKEKEKKDEAPPARESQRLKKRKDGPEVGTNVPESGEKDAQWALYERATKDPLSKLVGRRLGRTELTKLVTTTEVVTVFEGKYGDDERGALVKVLRPDRTKDKVFLERFGREAQVLSRIDHPNIARVLETGVEHGVRFLTTELDSGEPLSAAIEKGKLPPKRIVQIGRCVALGLASAHRANVVHRDIRPANLVVQEDGTVKIVGFGLARDVSVPGRLTATGQITGHPAYVAPEIARGEEITGKADVYSLGVVLFLATTGRLPFSSRSLVKLIGLHMDADVPSVLAIRPGCPPKLAQVIERVLAKDPAARPDAMEAANLLAAKDILEGGKADVDLPAVVDSEEEIRRVIVTEEEEPEVEESLGGPACAACELPFGDAKTKQLHGNTICEKCFERVESLDLCAACLHGISTGEANAADSAVFGGHIYCRACTARVTLPCSECGRAASLAGLAKGDTKAKGDLLVHATCWKGEPEAPPPPPAES